MQEGCLAWNGDSCKRYDVQNQDPFQNMGQDRLEARVMVFSVTGQKGLTI